MLQSTISKLQEGLPPHGGEPQRDLKRLGIAVNNILDFSVNVSPLGIPDEVAQHWPSLVSAVGSYPSIGGRGVELFFQDRFGIPQQNILAGNGSTEFIYLIPQALRIKKIVVVTPSFSDYTRSAHTAGAEVAPLKLSAKNGFACPEYNELRRALIQSDALFVGNPNNPTGTIYPKELLLHLARELPSKWIIVDEAFMQFFNNSEQITLMNHPEIENILVILSLTKFYNLPGLRIGALTGNEVIISRLENLKPPWTVNHIAELCALQLRKCKSYEARLNLLISKEKERMYSILKTLQHVTVFKPAVNFILGQWQKTDNLDDLMQYLLRQGLYIRDCRNFVGLEENYFRVAIRTAKENNRLVEALKKADLML